jgi:hypothetical protein
MVCKFRRHAIRAAIIICAWGACSALAADWIGNPSPSDYFRENLKGALVAASQMTAMMKQLTADIEDARRAYFKATTPAERAKTGDKFAKLLNAKDLIYAYTLLTHGLTPDLLRELELPFIDHGIPERNRNTYIDWLRGVRNSLGLKGDNALLIQLDEDSYKNAMIANSGLYASYQRLRDENEVWSWNERIGRADLNLGDKHRGLSHIDVSALPIAVKAKLSSSSQFTNWQNAAFYSDVKGTRYLVYFERTTRGDREFLFDAAGESASFDMPPAEQGGASKYDDCRVRAKQADLRPPYFEWYAKRCQFGPTPATDEEIKKWQHDGLELERLRAKIQPPRDNPRAQAEFSLKNYKCGMSVVPQAEAQKDPLLLPQCIDTYQLTDMDRKQLGTGR